MAPLATNQKYKIKLVSGRILGPIDLERVRLLVKEDQIHGEELAREHPQGEWMSINQIPALGEILVAHAQGLLGGKTASVATEESPESHPPVNAGTTRMLPLEKALPTALVRAVVDRRSPEQPIEQEEATQVAPRPKDTDEDSEATAMMVQPPASALQSQASLILELGNSQKGISPVTPPDLPRRVANESTIMMESPLHQKNWSVQDALRDPKRMPIYVKNKVRSTGDAIRGVAAAAAVGYIIFTLLSTNDDKGAASNAAWMPYRPTLPSVSENEKQDPAKSAKFYEQAIHDYVEDTVPGYKGAAQKLLQAIRYDNKNIKAEAMLASSYLNLIDSSNKDEKYFEVISRLIDLSRTKDIDLPETLIADVEFYLVINKPEAAQNRIVEYTRLRPHFGPEMFYYLALAFYQRGDITNANRFINQYRSEPFSAKVSYLRGQIDEALGDNENAIHEYERAIVQNPKHAKSRLAIARIMAASNHIQDAATQLEFLTSGSYRYPSGEIYDNRLLLNPVDLAHAYFLHSQLSVLHGNTALALGQMERAIHLDPGNHDYLLEYYSLRAKRGENLSKIQPEARMYYFLGEGEKFIKQGDYHSALTQFLLAREQVPNSTLPLVKIGDMFSRIHDLSNARENYKMAAKMAPKNIEIWTKYINTLIQSYEWDEAKSAMDRFRELPVQQSAIDKAAADMYAKQGNYAEAQTFYRKAMGRDWIDSSVYIAYAKSLVATQNYKGAEFFYALALRFDPLNIETIVGTAKCIAATESIDRAINFLKDEQQRGSFPMAELNAAIADFEIQKGSWPEAERLLDQAIQIDPDYAYSYYLRAQVYLSHEGDQRNALDKALDFFNSYSDRNQSDPSGYLERYRIFVKKGLYEKAAEELGKIFSLYPKYPNLHFYKGALYSLMGNHRAAIEEFGVEIKYNPNRPHTLVALGKEYAQLGGFEDALALFRRAMQLDSRLIEAKVEAANMNYRLKNYAAAAALYQAAIALDKGNPALYKQLGIAYRDAGDAANASQAFAKYLQMEPDAPDRAEFSH